MHWMQRIHRPTGKSSVLMILDCHCREAREQDYRAFRRVQAGPTGSLTPRWRDMDSNIRSPARKALSSWADVCFRGKDPEAALPSFRPRHRVHACGALDIFPLRALDVDQIAE